MHACTPPPRHAHTHTRNHRLDSKTSDAIAAAASAAADTYPNAFTPAHDGGARRLAGPGGRPLVGCVAAQLAKLAAAADFKTLDRFNALLEQQMPEGARADRG